MMEVINVVLADDHVLVRNGIKAMLESDPEVSVIGEANNGVEALEIAKRLKPDILILDIRMPELNGLEAAAQLPQFSPETKALILSMHDSDDYVLQALQSGAYGYVLKDIDKHEFVRALKQIQSGSKYFSGAVSNVLAQSLLGNKEMQNASTGTTTFPKSNQYHLTRRETEILSLIVHGKNNKDIADQLGKSVRTIETHRFNIMKKLGVNNAIDMVNKAMKEHLVE